MGLAVVVTAYQQSFALPGDNGMILGAARQYPLDTDRQVVPCPTPASIVHRLTRSRLPGGSANYLGGIPSC